MTISRARFPIPTAESSDPRVKLEQGCSLPLAGRAGEGGVKLGKQGEEREPSHLASLPPPCPSPQGGGDGNGTRGSELSAVGIILFGLLAVLSCPVQAQTNPVLSPDAASGGDSGALLIQNTAPVSLVPAPVPLAPQPVPVIKPVETGTLSEINPESVGLLAPNEGGLGSALWKGTPRLLVDHLLPTLTLPTASPTLNSLARRFLLTTASAPEGTAKEGQSLTSLRLDKLVTLGDATDAWKLMGLAKPALVDEITLRRTTEAALVSTEPDSICTSLPETMKTHTSVEWQKLLLLCQLRAKDTKAAQLSLDLLQTQNVKDEVYFDLVEKTILAGRKQLPRQLTPLKPLTLGLLRLADVPLPGEIYAHPEAGLIPALLQTHAADDTVRLALAERAAERGLVTSADLGAAYKSVSFPPDALVNSLASTETGARLHALLYQAALQEQTPKKRVDTVLKFMKTANAGFLSGAGASLLVEMIGSVPAGADYYDAAPSLAHIYMMAGKPETAKEWLDLAKRGSAGIPSLAAELQTLWPLAVLTSLELDGDYAAGLGQWLEASLKPVDPKADLRVQREKATSILLLLEAIGMTVPETAWAKVAEVPNFDKGFLPPAFLVERLRAASTANQHGETVLLSLLLETGGTGEPSLLVTVEIIRALRLVGLTSDAALLAREIANSLLMGTTP